MEAHQISEVDTSVAALKAVAEAVRAAMPFDVRCRIVYWQGTILTLTSSYLFRGG